MDRFVRSYLDHARGGSGWSSLWNVSLPLHWLARAWVGCRNGAFDRGILEQVEPPLPVVSVGNISLGGTNKTFMVEYLARRLEEAGDKLHWAFMHPFDPARYDLPKLWIEAKAKP